MFSIAAESPKTSGTKSAPPHNSSATTGEWSIVPSPNVPGANGHVLNAVTCVSPSNCWAVGYYSAAKLQTLIEHWNGTSWEIVPSPNSSTNEFNFLNSVACASANDCWAVGYFQNGLLTTRTLIEHWDGNSWTIIPSPDATTTRQNYLHAVTCLSAEDCWAVGYYQTEPTIFQTLIERWDGSSWSIAPSPNTDAARTNVLYGLTCVSASDCWAVGTNDSSTDNTADALAEHWDGTSWSIVPSGDVSPAPNNYFRGVACASTADCWAVDHSHAAFAGQTLAAHWNGSAWGGVISPNSSPIQNNYLLAVTCISGSDCWAAGYYDAGIPGAARYQTLIHRWDGSAWATASSPNSSPVQDNFLWGVTCASPWECWAVGYVDIGGGVTQTLTLRYKADFPVPTSAVSRKTHGAVGAFDIDLPFLGTAGTECRSGGANHDYEIVVNFANAVTFDHAAVTSGVGGVSSARGNGTTQVAVNLTGVNDRQEIALTIFGVNDGTNTGDVSIPMRVLLGDVNASSIVTSGDTNLCKAQALQPITADNFRMDINASGSITSGDANLIKQHALTQLPP